MLVFILIMFGLFILGVFIFIAANAGRGREDWNSMNSWTDTSTPMVYDQSATSCTSSDDKSDNSEGCGDAGDSSSDGGGGDSGGGGDGGGGGD